MSSIRIKKLTLYLQAFYVLVLLSLELKFLGFKKVLYEAENNKVNFLFSNNIYWNVKAIDFASKLIPGCTCLIKSIALKLISPVDHELSLVIGVSHASGFQSHAWIEKDNHIIFGLLDNQSKFQEILRVS